MKKPLLFLVFITMISSCKNEPSLQKYFVDKSESKEFISLDLGSSILNADKLSLTADEKSALTTFKKINVLAFKNDDKNKVNYQKEMKEVKTLLKDKTTYQPLVKVGTGSAGASMYFVGEDENIDEVVLFANKKENGFAVVRVLGNDMNPSDVMKIISIVQKSNINLEQFKPLQKLLE